MARAQGARSQLAAAFETVYGTPPPDGFTQMPFASTSLGAEQPLLNSELLGYGRDPLAPIKDAVTADGDVVVPVDAEAFGFWLKAAFGDPVTTGTGPWTHEFRSGAWTLPSMSIETAMPEVPRFAMYSGCMLDQLSWQMQRSGQLTATARLVAQGEAIGTTTGAGAPAAIGLKRFGPFNGAITRNGSPLGNVVSAEITYANNLDRIETIRSDGRIDGADPSIAALTGRVEVRFADQALVTQALNGDPCEFAFAYVLPSGESFSFTVHAVYLPRPRIEISGPQGVQASFDWQAAQDSLVGRMRWMDVAVLSGALDLPGYDSQRRQYQACAWLPTKWDWIDPMKDASAEILQIEAGLKSRTQALSERGYDAEQVDREIAAERQRELALGLDFRRPGSPAQGPGEGSGKDDKQDDPADDNAPEDAGEKSDPKEHA